MEFSMMTAPTPTNGVEGNSRCIGVGILEQAFWNKLGAVGLPAVAAELCPAGTGEGARPHRSRYYTILIQPDCFRVCG
jgi:hypothetical protein